MSDEKIYRERVAAWKNNLEKDKGAKHWVRLTNTSQQAYYGKVEKVDSVFVYLRPSLVYEDKITGNMLSGFRKEGTHPTKLDLGSLVSLNFMTEESIDALIPLNIKGETKKKTEYAHERFIREMEEKNRTRSSPYKK